MEKLNDKNLESVNGGYYFIDSDTNYKLKEVMTHYEGIGKSSDYINQANGRIESICNKHPEYSYAEVVESMRKSDLITNNFGKKENGIDELFDLT